MEHREGEFTGAGGLRIAWQAWLPAGVEPRAVIVISHGAGEHSGRYRHLVARLVPAGYAIHAPDHRGHGRSEGARGVIDRMDSVVADLDAFISQTRDAHPGVPLVLLGHSLGGCIGLEYALRHQDRLDALILSGPAAALEAASPAQRLIARGLSAVVPSLGILPVDPDQVSSDPDEVAEYVRDPLVRSGRVPIRTVAEAAAAIESFPGRVGGLTLPLLIVHGELDKLTAPRGSRMIHDGAGSADKTLHIYEGMRHELVNERPEARERVLDDIEGWLSERFPARAAAA